MVKSGSKKIKAGKPLRVRKVVVKRARPGRAAAQSTFGPVATIDTAPVSIGNSFNGAAPIISAIPNGQRIQGRDFLQNIDPTATTITSWTLVGGAPISPVAMISSGVKNLMTMYGNYCVHGVAVHFITSCTTSDVGSIMIYISKGRAEPGLNTTNENFMPLVLSDPNTIISPVWKNCSAIFKPVPEWRPTDLFSSDGLHEQSSGEIFAFTRINSVNVPGYFIIDYDISFQNMQANLKALSLPVARMKYTQVKLVDGGAVTGQVATYSWSGAAALLMDGVTLSIAPTGAAIGDIYKVIINAQDGYVGAGTLAQAFSINMPIEGGAVAMAATSYFDGATVYGVAVSATAIVLYPNYYAAHVGAAPLLQTATITGAVHAMIAYVSLVGTVQGLIGQSNF